MHFKESNKQLINFPTLLQSLVDLTVSIIEISSQASTNLQVFVPTPHIFNFLSVKPLQNYPFYLNV